MRIRILIISTFLTWVTYDLRLLGRRRDLSPSLAGGEISLSVSEEGLSQKKRIAQSKLQVIPKKWRGRPERVRSKCNSFSGKPKDVRYSDQRKIRRRINNL